MSITAGFNRRIGIPHQTIAPTGRDSCVIVTPRWGYKYAEEYVRRFRHSLNRKWRQGVERQLGNAVLTNRIQGKGGWKEVKLLIALTTIVNGIVTMFHEKFATSPRNPHRRTPPGESRRTTGD